MTTTLPIEETLDRGRRERGAHRLPRGLPSAPAGTGRPLRRRRFRRARARTRLRPELAVRRPHRRVGRTGRLRPAAPPAETGPARTRTRRHDPRHAQLLPTSRRSGRARRRRQHRAAAGLRLPRLDLRPRRRARRSPGSAGLPGRHGMPRPATCALRSVGLARVRQPRQQRPTPARRPRRRGARTARPDRRRRRRRPGAPRRPPIDRGRGNWKLTVDANIETYHVNTVHRTSAAVVLDQAATGIFLFPDGHSQMLVHSRDDKTFAIDLPGFPGASPLANCGIYSFHLFPNTSIVFGGSPALAFLITSWPSDRTAASTTSTSSPPRPPTDRRPAVSSAARSALMTAPARVPAGRRGADLRAEVGDVAGRVDAGHGGDPHRVDLDVVAEHDAVVLQRRGTQPQRSDQRRAGVRAHLHDERLASHDPAVGQPYAGERAVLGHDGGDPTRRPR